MSSGVAIMLRTRTLALLLVLIGCAFTFGGTVHAQEAPTPTPDTIPAAVPLHDEHGYDLINVLLLGSDTYNTNNSGRTDVLLIVSINPAMRTVAMLSIPRDLYVYLPSEGRMGRINTAFGMAETQSEGSGPAALAETIAYNLGITIDHYARVDFTRFQDIVDALGGVEISVDCGIQDWRLIEPDLDPQLETSWEMFTLPVGVHTMDGDLALWYARSRRTSDDFDRGRRHQALLRAIFHRLRSLDLLTQVRDIWGQVIEMVETDLTVEDLAGLLPLALEIDTSQMASYTFRPNREVRSWRAPDGSSVQVVSRAETDALVDLFLLPPTEHQLVQEQTSIAIINATGIRGMDRIAADRLAWEGFTPVILEPAPAYQDHTTLVSHVGRSKGSSLATIAAVMRLSENAIEIDPQAEREYDYVLTLGGTYFACTYNVIAPTPLTADDADESTG
jgi:LCP family protein required for cell wall assembly